MSTQLPPLITMFTIARSQGLWPHCLYFPPPPFWTARRELSCALVPVPSLRHFSFIYNLRDPFLPLQSFRYYQVLIPPFCSGSPFRHAISLLYHNTSHDGGRSLPELRPIPQIMNASPTQRLLSSLKSKWGKPTKPYLVRNDSSDGTHPFSDASSENNV